MLCDSHFRVEEINVIENSFYLNLFVIFKKFKFLKSQRCRASKCKLILISVQTKNNNFLYSNSSHKQNYRLGSSLNTVKSSISGNTHYDSQAFSCRAMNLLLKLDSIQVIITQLCAFHAHLYNFARNPSEIWCGFVSGPM